MTFSPITLGRVVRTRRVGTLNFTQSEHVPRSTLAMHAHECSNLTFVLSGAFGERLPSRSFAIGAHEIVIKAPGEKHANDYGHAATRCLSIEFDGSWLGGDERIANLLMTTMHTRDRAVAETLLRTAIEVGRESEISTMAVEELVLEALATLARVPLPARRASWIADVTAYLDERYAEAISLTTVAETFGIERSLLARVFRREVGTTIGGYVRRLRIHHACRELLSSSTSVADVAAAAGFADHAHLCRVFKASVGAVPTEFRRLRD